MSQPIARLPSGACEHRQPALKAPTDTSEWIVAVEAIGAKLIELGWRSSDDQSQVVRLAADFADTDEWARAGYSTPGRWIASLCGFALR